MKYCGSCGGVNSDDEIYCDYCGALLPSIYGINRYIKENFQLFTIMGVFLALSFYLTNFLLSMQNKSSDILVGNLTGTINQSIVFSGTIVANISQNNSSFFNSTDIITGLPASIILGLGVVTSYFIFLGILVILILNVSKIDRKIEKTLCLFPLIMILGVTFLYLLTVYRGAISQFLGIFVVYAIFLIYNYIYDRIYARDAEDHPNRFAYSVLVIGLVSLIMFLISIIFFATNITKVSQNPASFEELLLAIETYASFGLMIGTMIGFATYELRFLTDSLKYETKRGKLLLGIIGSVLFIVAFVVLPILKITDLTWMFLIIGSIAVFNAVFSDLKTICLKIWEIR